MFSVVVRRLPLLVAALIVLIAQTACPGKHDYDITIRVVSDLIAGPEAAAVGVVVTDANNSILRSFETDLRFDQPIVRGRDVAYIIALPRGEYTFKAKLFRPNGEILAKQTLIINVDDHATYTLYMS